MDCDKQKNLYEILGVNKDAKYDDIKCAYRKLIKKYCHYPNKIDFEHEMDRNAFKIYQKAYNILSDDIKREHYDKTGDIIEYNYENDIFNYIKHEDAMKIQVFNFKDNLNNDYYHDDYNEYKKKWNEFITKFNDIINDKNNIQMVYIDDDDHEEPSNFFTSQLHELIKEKHNYKLESFCFDYYGRDYDSLIKRLDMCICGDKNYYFIFDNIDYDKYAKPILDNLLKYNDIKYNIININLEYELILSNNGKSIEKLDLN